MAMMLGAVGSIVSGVIGAIGAMQQAKAAEQAAKYNQAVDERNRGIVLSQTNAEISSKAAEHRRQRASIRAAYGANGFTMEGSPLAVLEDTAIEQSLDIHAVDYRGKLKALGYQDQAVLHGMEAKNARKAGTISAAAALFGGISSAGTSLLQG